MIYGVPIEAVVGLGVGLVVGGLSFAVHRNEETKNTVAGLIGTGSGLIAAAICYFVRH